MTIQFPLTRGMFATIDEGDLPLVSKYKWQFLPSDHTSYAKASILGPTGYKTVGMHRLILDAKPGQQVDHVDGNGLNNSRANIRLCTHGQNSQNRRKLTGSSKYKGVSWNKDNKRWYVVACAKHIGTFTNEIDAAKAYDRAARELFGDFARTNF